MESILLQPPPGGIGLTCDMSAVRVTNFLGFRCRSREAVRRRRSRSCKGRELGGFVWLLLTTSARHER